MGLGGTLGATKNGAEKLIENQNGKQNTFATQAARHIYEGGDGFNRTERARWGELDFLRELKFTWLARKNALSHAEEGRGDM